MESLSQENRSFPPSDDFVAQARISGIDDYRERYERSIENPTEFWSTVAKELHWYKPWDKVLDTSDAPFYQWFVNGQTNICYNCVDRIVEAGKADKVAFHWEGEPGDKRSYTYGDLLASVSCFANVLKGLGVVKGDRIALYLLMLN